MQHNKVLQKHFQHKFTTDACYQNGSACNLSLPWSTGMGGRMKTSTPTGDHSLMRISPVTPGDITVIQPGRPEMAMSTSAPRCLLTRMTCRGRWKSVVLNDMHCKKTEEEVRQKIVTHMTCKQHEMRMKKISLIVLIGVSCKQGEEEEQEHMTAWLVWAADWMQIIMMGKKNS